MLFYCSEQMQNRGLNTCKQDIYSFLHFSLPTNTEPRGVRLISGRGSAPARRPAAPSARRPRRIRWESRRPGWRS